MLKYIAGFLVLLVMVYWLFLSDRYPLKYMARSFNVGDTLDSHNGVYVINNGADYGKSHGKNYSAGKKCYYGKKWQCVEFIKRYYFDHMSYTFPDGMGHAKDFFDKQLDNGQLNKRRGLLQYKNGGNEPPKPNDILVFDGKYGHVAIVTKVEESSLEVVQQNIFMRPRQTFELRKENGDYLVGDAGREPLGWLRLRKTP